MAVTDDFNRANSGTLGSNWTDTVAGMGILSNEAVPVGGGYVFARYTGTGWNSTHSSAGKFIGGGGADMELTVRHQVGGDLIMVLINSGSGICYLFKYISGGFTFLHDFATAPTSGFRYKLEVVGNTYSLYEDSGSGYVQAGTSVVDATLSAGGPGIGGSGAAPGQWDDWVGTGETSTDAIAIASPTQYQTFQRSVGNQADVTITGTYTGTPTSIEASFNGGSYATIVASPAGGSYSGTLRSQAAGQGGLTVRFTNNTAILDTTDDVGIGDVFLVGGDSRAEGRGTNPQSYTGSIKSTVFRQDDAWANGNDAVDTGTSSGSHWPLLASLLMSDQSVPVSFITAGTGSTDVAGTANEWATGNSALTELLAQAAAAGTGKYGFKGALFLLGPNAVVNGSTLSQATYNAAIDTLATNLSVLSGSPKLMVDICGEVSTGSPPDRRAALDHIRAAILEAASDNPRVLLGPNLIEQNYADGVHPASDAELQEVADRFWVAMKNGFYSGTLGRGPQLSAVTLNAAKTVITAWFDRALASGTNYVGFRVTDSGTPATITSIVRASTRTVLITVSAPLSAAANVAVSFGSNEDAKGQVVPTSTTVTLPDTRTILLPAEPFYDRAITAARFILGPH